MGPWGEFANIAEFNLIMSKDGIEDKMIIIDKEGALRTADEYEQISLDPGSYNPVELPYFLKVSKIREIIFRTEGICNRMTYRIWRNMPYPSGHSETMIGDHRRQLTASELEHVARYF